MISNSIIYNFFKDLTNHRKKTNRAIFFSSRPFPTFLNTGTTKETFQHSGKQGSFRNLLKSSASMEQSSSSQFFRTTTGTLSGQDAFDKSRFILTFLTILGVIEIVCSCFRLVLEGIPDSSRLEFLGKFQETILLYQMQKTTPPGRSIVEV